MAYFEVRDCVPMPAHVADPAQATHVHTVDNREVFGRGDDDVNVEH